MGTTLTGTTPQDTYDSLIKVTDNGPLSGTAKYLSDGLGNDSALALSTGAVGIGTATPSGFTRTLKINAASGTIGLILADSDTDRAGFYVDAGTSTPAYIFTNNSKPLVLSVAGSEAARITSAGNVGIGTSSPESKLHIAGTASGSDVTLYIDNVAASTLNNSTRLKFSSDLGSSVSGGGAELNCIIVDAGNGAVDLLVKSWSGGAYSEKARFLAGGGLTFNGDTAAANALDDYEEGTWTMGIAFGGASVGVTYLFQEASYTKIGRQVTATGVIVLSSKGSSSGNVAITGLPFTIPNSLNRFCAATLRCIGVSFANQFQGEGVINSTTVELNETTEAGVGSALTEADIANNANIALTITYFV